jgi:dienelactone hydrolase
VKYPFSILFFAPLLAQESLVTRPILDPRQALMEVQVYTASRVPLVPSLSSAVDWERYASRLRQRVLDEVVFRGEAARWRDAKTKVEMLDELGKGDGYRVRKFRYEVIPGLWTGGLIYEPVPISGKVPVVLNVNGHERTGIATPYIQWRCINLAKKGVLAVNFEWFGMGQLNTPGFGHYRMPQIDLTGTAGIALFFLEHRRALDIALAHPNADPKRVAVTGLSGGGWQTIFLSALDTRVGAAMPLAGYSSFTTRAQWPTLDLGDSEQTPSDLASIADYSHLTALMAPRHLVIANNAKDTCCFRADYAPAPLIQAATPVYRLFNAAARLGYHINHGDGHNYDADNREAFYRLLRDAFLPGMDVRDISVTTEIRTADAVRIPLPGNNLDFHSIALKLAEGLPRKKASLASVVRSKALEVDAWTLDRKQDTNGVSARYFKLNMDRAWTVPAVMLTKGHASQTVMVIADNGKNSVARQIEALVNEGAAVMAIDPFYFGESKIAVRDYLFAMLIAALGERPLGLQASQVIAAARWTKRPVKLIAFGPRTSLIAAVAHALDPAAIPEIVTHEAFGSLREILDKDLTIDKFPELFAFGLLEHFELVDGKLR